jgi:hypothetical protein
MDRNGSSDTRCPPCDTLVADSDVRFAESGVVVLWCACGLVREPADNMPGR